MMYSKKIFALIIFFTINLLTLSSESFRVRKLIPVHISGNSTEEQTISCGINDSIGIFLPKDRTYLDGIEIKVAIPPSVAEWRDSVACSLYDFIQPTPSSNQIDYSGNRIFVTTVPTKLSWILQLLLNNDENQKSSQYATKINITPADYTFLRFQPAMKGIPDDTLNAQFKLSIKPILKNKGKLKLKITAEDCAEIKYSLYLDEQPISVSKNELLLSTGMHKIDVLSDEYRNEVRSFIIEQAKDTNVEINLRSLEPTLKIQTPENSKFFIDENECKQKDIPIVISEGEHKLRFILGDYEIIRMINIQKGKSYTINLSVDLQITEE